MLGHKSQKEVFHSHRETMHTCRSVIPNGELLRVLNPINKHVRPWHEIAFSNLMPTLLRKDGFRFFFYSGEGREPAHVHVIGRGGEMKVWLDPVKVAQIYRLSDKDRRDILQIILVNVKDFRAKWRAWHESNC